MSNELNRVLVVRSYVWLKNLNGLKETDLLSSDVVGISLTNDGVRKIVYETLDHFPGYSSAVEKTIALFNKNFLVFEDHIRFLIITCEWIDLNTFFNDIIFNNLVDLNKIMWEKT